VSIPRELAERLEERRLEQREIVRDRGVIYEKHYDIGSGQAFSQSFSSASKRALGWSEGAHGLRHSYAQERMDELRRGEYGLDRERALETVAQEMGHFREEITETYLR
jgi:integrase